MRRSILLIASLGFAILGSSRQGWAQAGLREGVKIRVNSPGSPEVTGVVQSLTPDSIFIYAEPLGTKIGISRTAITKLQVSHGKSASNGAKKGAAWGAATFGLLGVLIATTQDEDQLRADTGASAAEFAAISVLEGILGGAAIGALIKSEKWETVAVHPALTSRSAGVRIGFSFR
jgi:hypothetical protein